MNSAFERIAPTLKDVPETLLWPLRSRAAVSVTDRAFFDDPLAVDTLNRIDYDFGRFGPVSDWHAIRSKWSDDLIRAYLKRFPTAQVLALGEGLETQFWRVDNDQVRWLAVDLPESISLRRQLLPEHPRLMEVQLSALDPKVMDFVDPSHGLFVTAAGLLMYFNRAENVDLLQRIGGMGGQTEIFFDAIPPCFSRRTMRGFQLNGGYTAPEMPFALDRAELRKFAEEIPGFDVIAALNYADVYPDRTWLFAALGRVPVLRNLSPILVHARLSQ